jgi:hypothetical protein
MSASDKDGRTRQGSDVPGTEIVPLGWCVEAMQRAVERVRSIGWNDTVGEYAAVAETLYWIDVVEHQLSGNHQVHYEAALADQPGDAAMLLRGLSFARNRITHEVDQVGYVLARAKGSEGFDAHWTWQSLPPRPPGPHQQAGLHADYDAALVGKDVVETLLAALTCLGQAMSRMVMSYGTKHA